MATPEQINLREATEGLVKVFAAFFGAAYVCGYLIATSHLEELGIRSGNLNMIKAKYMWLGFLYLLPLLAIAAATSAFWLNPQNLLQKLQTRFRRKTKRATSYANQYRWVVLFVVIIICSRLMFFDAEWREDTAASVCTSLAAFTLYMLAHRLEIFQVARLDELRQSEVVFGRTTSADLHHRKENARDLELSIDRSHDFKDLIFFVSFLSFSAYAYDALARIELPSLPHLQSGFLVRHSDVFTFISYICTLVCLQIQLTTAFSRDSLPDTAASMLGPADPSLYTGRTGAVSGPESSARKRARWALRTIVMLVLFLGSIHGFTHVVYPLIPPERGGGDYLRGRVADVCVRSNDIVSTVWIPQAMQASNAGDFCDSGTILKDLIILDEDADAVYVASIYDQGIHNSNPPTGYASRCGLQNWHVGTEGPLVISLRQNDVIGERDTDSVEHFCRAAGTNASPRK